MSPRRIIVIVTHLHDGGAHVVANTMAEKLAERGHSVEIWFLYQKQEGFSSRVPWRVVLPRGRVGALGYPRIFRDLVAELRRAAPDAVLSHLPLGNVMGQLAARLAGVPVRVTVQHTEAWTFGPVMKSLDRLVGSLGTYTRNIAVSRTVAESFAAYPESYRRHIRVIPNAIEIAPATLEKTAARAHFGLPASAPLIIAIGRLSEQKNHAVLLRAVAGLEGVHLAIAGDGELRADLEALVRELDIADRVHLLGNLPRERISDFMRAGDVWAFPSLFEGMSLSLLEAIHAGLPIAASTTPSNVEVLEAGADGAAALLLEPNDVDAWRKGLAELIGDPGLRESYVERVRKLAPRFSMERMTDDYEGILCAPAEAEPAGGR